MKKIRSGMISKKYAVNVYKRYRFQNNDMKNEDDSEDLNNTGNFGNFVRERTLYGERLVSERAGEKHDRLIMRCEVEDRVSQFQLLLLIQI